MATLDRYRLSSFTVDVQDAAVLASLRNGAKRQSYAIANAINTTLLAVQASVPKHLRKQGFVIRKPKFFFGGRGMRGGVANYISDFANAKRGKIWGRIDAGSSNPGTARRLLLGQFEDGGARKPMTPGARAVAVPLLGRPARPNVAQGVVPAYTFAGLKFRKFVNGQEVKRKRRGRKEAASGFFGEYGRLQLNRVIGDSSVQWKGALRTFILPKSRQRVRTPQAPKGQAAFQAGATQLKGLRRAGDDPRCVLHQHPERGLSGAAGRGSGPRSKAVATSRAEA
jgi:hypothetical protein